MQLGLRTPTPKFMRLRGRPIDYVGMDEGQLSKQEYNSLKQSLRTVTE